MSSLTLSIDRDKRHKFQPSLQVMMHDMRLGKSLPRYIQGSIVETRVLMCQERRLSRFYTNKSLAVPPLRHGGRGLISLSLQHSKPRCLSRGASVAGAPKLSGPPARRSPAVAQSSSDDYTSLARVAPSHCPGRHAGVPTGTVPRRARPALRRVECATWMSLPCGARRGTNVPTVACPPLPGGGGGGISKKRWRERKGVLEGKNDVREEIGLTSSKRPPRRRHCHCV